MDLLIRRSLSAVFPLVAMVFAIAAGSARAQLSPGELSEGHASLEGVKNCTKCHDSDQNLVGEKCLACHTALKSRVDAGMGLHARPEQADCKQCHVEHQGRDFKLVHWSEGEKAFDHAKTGYALEGAHGKLACRECHQAKYVQNRDPLQNAAVNMQTTFLGLDRDCRSCHADEHRGQFAQACTECHSSASWKPAAGFSHAKTKFALTGKHSDVVCEKCHLPIIDQRGTNDTLYLKFTQIAHSQCSDCHKDPHQTRLGDDCTRCHTTQGWQQVTTASFNHDKTRFPLIGQHSGVACDKCHFAGQRATSIKFASCRDCHIEYHKDVFAKRPGNGACEECHTVQGWSPAKFSLAQHDSTDFALAGAHRAIPCVACHKTTLGEPSRFVFTSTQCAACHVDIHKGSLASVMADAGCTACHTVGSWAVITYDHGTKTKFALDGKHAQVACDKCHKRGDEPKAPIVFSKLATQCGNCHQDRHFGQFAATDEEKIAHRATTGCEHCHTTSSWRAARFNHASARFVLDGAHSRVPCDGCHKSIVIDGNAYIQYTGTATTCAGCHGSQTPPPRGAS